MITVPKYFISFITYLLRGGKGYFSRNFAGTLPN